MLAQEVVGTGAAHAPVKVIVEEKVYGVGIRKLEPVLHFMSAIPTTLKIQKMNVQSSCHYTRPPKAV